MISSIFMKKTLQPKMLLKRNEIGENEENTIECYNKFVRPKSTELEICFPALMQLLVPVCCLRGALPQLHYS